MSRQLEQGREDAARRRANMLVDACEGGLLAAVEYAGGELLGFSVKLSSADCLLTVRAEFPAGRRVAFVGSDTLAGAILKATREARVDALRWKVDKYAK